MNPPTDEGRGPAVLRFESLSSDAPLDVYFDLLRDAIKESYLAEPDNQYRESGRSSGAERWEESRKCLAEAVHRNGAFLDVGCANGLLIESLERWLAPHSIRIDPHGVDFVPELIALTRVRLSRVPADHFHVANVWDWVPPRQYDFVRTSLDYVSERFWTEWVGRQWERLVAPGGRLILCWYYSSKEVDTPQPSPEKALESLGMTVIGTASALGIEVAWADKLQRGPRPHHAPQGSRLQ